MSQIFRELGERYNPQIHTEDLSLTINMNKNFAVKEKSFELFANKNKFISFLYATGRINMGAKQGKVMAASGEISDNAYRVQYQGSLFIPAYATGDAHFGIVFAGNDMTGNGITYEVAVGDADGVVHNVVGSIAVKHDPASNVFGEKFNEGDVIILGAYEGAHFIVMGTPRKASTNDHYIVNVKCQTPTGFFAEADLADGELLSEGGNRFGEGSQRGYQRERRTKWKINYSFISRSTLTITGSALSQKKVVWLRNTDTGARMWEWEAVLDLRERHATYLELGCRYSRTSMDASSHKWFEDYGTNLLTLDGFTADYGIVAPVIGDGWVSQLDDVFTVTYNPNNDFPIALLELFMTVLAQRSPAGPTGNTFVGIGDKLGHIKIDQGFKRLVGWNSTEGGTVLGATQTVFNYRTGKEHSLGFSINKYNYLGNTFIFIEDDLMNNPAFVPQNGGIIGTGTIYVLNASMVNGVSNIDLLARTGRALRAKYIDGMHSLDKNRDGSSVAATGFDGGRYDLLSEYMPIIYSTESCGKIKASAKFAGGALSGEPVASENVTTWHY
jgi:hypothetical protein